MIHLDAFKCFKTLAHNTSSEIFANVRESEADDATNGSPITGTGKSGGWRPYEHVV